MVSEDKGQHMLSSAVPSVESNSCSGLRASVPNIVSDEAHRIQTHVVDLDMLETAQQRLSEDFLFSENLEYETILDSASSPDQSGILTPPSSSRKNSPTPTRRSHQLKQYT